LLDQALRKSRGNGFDILAQQYKSEGETPIETGYTDWHTPYTKIGFVVIDSDHINTSGEDFCRALNFNPWNTAPDYQPIGGIQRARKVVYTEIQKLRRQYQTNMGKNIVNSGPNANDASLQAVEQAYPLAPNVAKHEAEVDAADYDSAESEVEPSEIAHLPRLTSANNHHSTHVKIDVTVN